MRILAALLAFCSTLTFASSSTTDFTDLWWNPNENGWGANVVHQRDTLFVTLFVYGPTGAPTWYVASNVSLTSTSAGTFTYSGPLYRTTGSYFGGPHNANSFDLIPVGSLTFVAGQVNQATLSYVADGVTVVKSLTRQTWKSEDMTGIYVGATMGNWINCTGRNGYTEDPVRLTVTHTITNTSSTVNVREDAIGGVYSCTYTGTYTQTGKLGSVTGTGVCSDGINQSFTMSEIQAGAQSLSMRFTANVGSCSFVARMGGMRRG